MMRGHTATWHDERGFPRLTLCVCPWPVGDHPVELIVRVEDEDG